ncbi:hypothetical protein BCR33DRAFT_787651 [Rhizoclosmatium globosum]|uniref:RecQ-mediated genome instability protein 1 n=1 Tax=Rhizoclosmatium globosum TaxID=329046 RepID=A0A1Y2BZ81_9FUNG|nr:hypothetical protein BCR33DRAFT_787651 [Rhizoclosmatium globosum]|eukprot:ORY40082.1 hypothetical protein BCR33DRAFT_787651 [Rhizoclosmatium globosum]
MLPPSIGTQHNIVLAPTTLQVKLVTDCGIGAFEMLERIQQIKDEAESKAYEKLRKTKAGGTTEDPAHSSNFVLTPQFIRDSLPRSMLQLTLTDGTQDVVAVELERLNSFSVLTPLGSKVLVKNAKLKRGVLHIRNENIQLLPPSTPAPVLDPKEILKYLERLYQEIL